MSTIRILFVDDSAAETASAESALEQAGIHAQSLTVGDEDSLRIALENWDPEVIVAGSAVPGFDGFKAFEIARQLTPDVPFLFQRHEGAGQLAAKIVRVVNESRATLELGTWLQARS
jgi:CheY-like chemotaxis protein